MQRPTPITTDYFVPEEHTTLSISHIIKEVDNILCCQVQAAERLAHRPLANFTGCGTALFCPAIWLNAHRKLTRVRLGLYVDDTYITLLRPDDLSAIRNMSGQ